VVFAPVIKKFMKEVNEILGEQYTAFSTGIMDLSFNIFREMQFSMAKTYVIALMVITPLMILLIGSVKIGLVSMLPNLAPIIITLGVMSLVGIDLTAATLLTGSIAIGLVVDDTIHFMHNFRRFFGQTGCVQQAIHKTLETTGQAITFTTIVLTSAFMIFMLNEVSEWAYFGFITGFCISIALLADLLLAPALVTLLFHDRQPSSS
jgi:predicted RND superfamily exporter protein